MSRDGALGFNWNRCRSGNISGHPRGSCKDTMSSLRTRSLVVKERRVNLRVCDDGQPKRKRFIQIVSCCDYRCVVVAVHKQSLDLYLPGDLLPNTAQLSKLGSSRVLNFSIRNAVKPYCAASNVPFRRAAHHSSAIA